MRWNEETGQVITKAVMAVRTGLTVSCGNGDTHKDAGHVRKAGIKGHPTDEIRQVKTGAGMMPDLSQLSDLSR